MIYKIKILFYKLCKVLPIKKRNVLIFSYYGANYGGSPKYISKYLNDQDDYFNVFWAFNDVNRFDNLKRIKKVKYSSFKYYYHLATSHFIITNYRMTSEFEKRSSQKYIQTWHSSLRLKMIEKDAENTLPKHYVEMAKKDSKQIDVLLTGSAKSKEIYNRSFWYDGEYLDCGTPQCDLFFTKNNELKNKVYTTLNISNNKKIILYAPTFRKDHSLDAYDIDFETLIKTLENKFGGEWVVLLRLHPHLINLTNKLNFNENIINATHYDDMQELLYVADVVVTDYSALMFDYVLTNKPCFIYANDYNDYVSKDRKLYFDLKKLPFPISYSNKELNEQVANFEKTEYEQKYNNFKLQEIGIWETGNACKKVYEYMKGEL